MPKGDEGNNTGGTARRLIRQLMRDGMTQEEIGSRTNRSASTIGQILRGEIDNPPEELIAALRRLVR